MKKIIAIAAVAAGALALGGAGAVRAQTTAPAAQAAIDPATLKAVQALFEAMDYRRSIKDTVEQMAWGSVRSMRPMIEARLKSDRGLSEEQRKNIQGKLAKLDERMPKLTMVIMDALSDPALIDQLVEQSMPTYAQNYTVPELEQLTAFYRSPIGVKLLEVSPKVYAESMLVSQKLMAERLEPMKQKLMDIVQQD